MTYDEDDTCDSCGDADCPGCRGRDGDDDDDGDGDGDTLVEAMRAAFKTKGYTIIRTAEHNRLRETANYHETVCDKQRGDSHARDRVKEDHRRMHDIKTDAGETLEYVRKLVAAINDEENIRAKFAAEVLGIIDAKSKRVLAVKLGFPVGATTYPTRPQIAKCRRKHGVANADDLVGALYQMGIITVDEHSYLVQNTQVPAADYAYRGYKS